MTSAQLKHLLRVLNPGSGPEVDEGTRVRSSEWRRGKGQTRREVSLGSLLPVREERRRNH